MEKDSCSTQGRADVHVRAQAVGSKFARRPRLYCGLVYSTYSRQQYNCTATSASAAACSSGFIGRGGRDWQWQAIPGGQIVHLDSCFSHLSFFDYSAVHVSCRCPFMVWKTQDRYLLLYACTHGTAAKKEAGRGKCSYSTCIILCFARCSSVPCSVVLSPNLLVSCGCRPQGRTRDRWQDHRRQEGCP